MNNYVSYDGIVNLNNGNKLTGLNLSSTEVNNMINRQKAYKESIDKKQVLVPQVYYNKTLQPQAYNELKKLGIGHGYKKPY